MGGGVSSLPNKMTISQVEEAAGFQARLLGNIKERFEAIQKDKTITKEQYLIGCSRGFDGSPGGDLSPEESLIYNKELNEKAIEQEEKAKQAAIEKAKALAEAKKTARIKKEAADIKAANAKKYGMTQFKVKAYDPEEIKKRLAEQEQRTKKKQAMLALDASKAETKKQRDKILRVQAREQEKIFDLKARVGLTDMKDQRSRMTIEDKEASRTQMKAVSYDEQTTKNAKDTSIVETCSCLQGEACLDPDNCLDWFNRFTVAKAYGMGFGKDKTGVHFSAGEPLAKVFGESSETLTVNGKLLDRGDDGTV
jgi:hypothetical protein